MEISTPLKNWGNQRKLNAQKHIPNVPVNNTKKQKKNMKNILKFLNIIFILNYSCKAQQLVQTLVMYIY
jgi:hypothetical protein